MAGEGRPVQPVVVEEPWMAGMEEAREGVGRAERQHQAEGGAGGGAWRGAAWRGAAWRRRPRRWLLSPRGEGRRGRLRGEVTVGWKTVVGALGIAAPGAKTETETATQLPGTSATAAVAAAVAEAMAVVAVVAVMAMVAVLV